MVESSEGIAWAGEDFTLGTATIIPAGGFQILPVIFEPGALPEGPVSSQEIERLSSSGQSKLAQIGINLRSASPADVADAIRMNGFEDISPDYLPADVRIDSHYVDVALDKGMSLGRFYRPGKEIVGEELMDLISSKKITIGGGDQTWRYYYKNGYKKGSGNIEGIVVRIEAGKKLWIPSTTPLIRARDIQNAGREYRKEIDKYLVSAPETSSTVLWIGNTSVEIGMDEDINAILDREVYSSITTRGREGLRGKHINARLLDGGKSWQIRVEVLGPTIRNGDNFIILRFKQGARKS